MDGEKRAPLNIPTRSVEDFMVNQEATFLFKYKGYLIGGLIAIIGGIALYGMISSHLKSRENENLTAIKFFETKELKEYSDSKIDEAKLIESYESLVAKTKGTESLVQIALPLADTLLAKGKNEEAERALLATEKSGAIKNSVAKYMVAVRLAVAYEDQGKLDLAIKKLEEIISSKVKVVEAKLYLDLGRIYLKQGNTESARKNLQLAIDNSAGEEFSRIAKIYMEKIK